MTELDSLLQRIEELTKENQQLRQIVFDLLNYNNSVIATIEKPLENFKEFNSHFLKTVSKAKAKDMKGEYDDRSKAD